MRSSRLLVHSVFLFVLPIAVAAFGWSVWTAIALVLLMLVWRWLVSLLSIAKPERRPELELDAISISHFVEKVRWNLDLTGLEYAENVAGGTLGAYFTGRTVPRLRFRTGAVRSEIGNSAEILRYLWGRYGAELGDRAKHLEPTADRLDLESQCDRYGSNLQVWCYNHVLPDRGLTLHAWGSDSPLTPAWQRLVLKLLYPLLSVLIRRSFRITPNNVVKVTERIEQMLEKVDTALADGRKSILGGDEPNYTDYAFAAMSGVWMQVEQYGGGRADHVRIEREHMPEGMRADVDRWREDYPRVVAWVEELYSTRPRADQS
ncbi:MAG: glutathione S-transferase N-terminal domain-containing protein [Pseudomonadota bacterium]